MDSFETIIPYLQKYLTKHHELYDQRCKAEYLEELFCKALQDVGLGSDWKPDNNHKSGTDQTTDSGLKISNKSGSLNMKGKKFLSISGSRLTSHETLNEKIEYLSKKTEDYVVCLAANEREWSSGKKTYYLIIVDANKLDYANALWEETFYKTGKNAGKLNGYVCIGNGFKASIQKSMSDQLWTTIEEDLFDKIYEIVI